MKYLFIFIIFVFPTYGQAGSRCEPEMERIRTNYQAAITQRIQTVRGSIRAGTTHLNSTTFESCVKWIERGGNYGGCTTNSSEWAQLSGLVIGATNQIMTLCNNGTCNCPGGLISTMNQQGWNAVRQKIVDHNNQNAYLLQDNNDSVQPANFTPQISEEDPTTAI